MVVVNIRDGVECYLDENLKKNLDEIKDSVLNKGWDYVCVIAGIPGAGKTTFAQQVATYLDPTFDVDRICFTGKDYINKTEEGKLGQAFQLDESFADLNTMMSRNPDFIAIIDHLQTIRKRGEFHILILPDFFTLARGVAVFRTSHLFVVYADRFERGRFAAFGRDNKRKLYNKGKPFSDYHAEEPNFRGRFVSKKIIDWEEYERRKDKHLREKANRVEVCKSAIKWTEQRNKLIKHLVEVKKYTHQQVGDILGVESRAIEAVMNRKTREQTLSTELNL